MKLNSGFFAVLALMVISSAYAEASPSKFFTDLSAQERYSWLDGALLTAAHALAMQDKALGDCASKFYVSDKDGKQRLITATIAKYPNESPTTIILTLLGQACGPLAPKRASNR